MRIKLKRKQGVKLRDVQLEDHRDDFLWDEPRPNSTHLRFMTLEETEGIRRMVPLRLKSAVALSFYWENGLVNIGAHTSDNDLSPYGVVQHEQGISVYIPLDEYEVIIEVWKCSRRFHPSASLVVSILVTFETILAYQDSS